MPATLTRWLIAVLLAVSSVPFVFSGGAAYADTSEDTVAPQITSVEIISGDQLYAPGDTVTVRIGFVEEGTGVSSASVDLIRDEDFIHGSSSSNGWANAYIDCSDAPRYTGTLDVEVTLPESAREGSWHVSSIGISDQRGNNAGLTLGYYEEEGRFVLSSDLSQTALNSPGFSVGAGASQDYVAPVVRSVRIVDEGVAKHPGETVVVAVDVVEDGSGVVSLSCNLEHRQEHGIDDSTLGGIFADGYIQFDSPRKTGTIEVEVPLPENAVEGEWVVSWLGVSDQNGNDVYLSREYNVESDEFTLANITEGGSIPNPSFTVVPIGTVNDRSVPQIFGMKIVGGDVVNRPGVARVEVFFEDEGTGVASVNLEASPGVYCDGHTGTLAASYATAEISDPVAGKGSAVVELPIGSKDLLGEWKVTAVYLTDAAGNSNYAYIYGHGDEEYYNYFNIQGEEVLAPRFTVEDEFDFAFEMALSNPRLQEAVEGIDEGYAARILIDGDGVLSEGVLSAIAGKDVTLVCYKDAYQWVINGNDIVNEPKDLDLDVDIIQESGYRYDVDEDVVRLVFYPNGQLPGPIQLRFKSDYLYTFAGLEGSLHLYYLDNGEYVEEDGDIDLVFDGTDKWCYATFTHNSEFVVSPCELSSNDGATGVKPLDTQSAGGSRLAATGDGLGMALGAFGVTACVAGLAAWRARKSAARR